MHIKDELGRFVSRSEISGNDKLRLIEVISREERSDYSDIEVTYMKNKLNKALMTLTPRQENCIRLFFGIGTEPKTTKEIGKIYDISYQAVHAIIKKGLGRLRLYGRIKKLQGLL